MKRLLKIVVILALTLTALLGAGKLALEYYVRDKLSLNPTEPAVEKMPPGALIANLPPYSGAHPSQLQRPPETFPFPVGWGETGPAEALFAGPRQYPFMCQTLDSELGNPLPDNQQGYGTPVYDGNNLLGYSKDCGLPTELHYLGYNQGKYFRADGKLPLNFDDQQADNLLVRTETGTINRFIYVLLMPTTRKDQRDQPDLSRWNGKAVFHFKGAIGIGFQQGEARLQRLIKDMRPALEAGFAVLYSTGNETDNHYNITLQEDTALRVKQQFIARYGKPEYTIGFGASGGGLQQYLLTQNHPANAGQTHIIDGGVAIQAYPDMLTQTTYGLDCELLEYYFDHLAAERDFWQPAQKRSLIEGLAYNPDYKPKLYWLADLASWLRLQKPPLTQGATECNYSWRGSAQLVNNPRFNSHYPRYSAEVNAQNFWSHWQDNRDVYGTDRNGRALLPLSNVGVQYGLNAWKNGDISAAQFLDLNRHVGSWKAQADMQPEHYWLISGDDSLRDFSAYGEQNMSHEGLALPLAPRMNGNLASGKGAYLSGNVFIGRLDIPLIDVRPYKDPELDIHHSWAAFSSRARILANNQGHNDWQSIWVSDARFDARWPAFFAMDQWLTERRQKPADDNAIPDFASDRCFDSEGSIIASGTGVWDGNWNQQAAGACSQAFPQHQGTRQVAGDSIAGGILFCQRISIADAIRSGLYLPLNATPYQQQLEDIFPHGVCDYRQPDQARPF